MTQQSAHRDEHCLCGTVQQSAAKIKTFVRLFFFFLHCQNVVLMPQALWINQFKKRAWAKFLLSDLPWNWLNILIGISELVTQIASHNNTIFSFLSQSCWSFKFGPRGSTVNTENVTSDVVIWGQYNLFPTFYKNFDGAKWMPVKLKPARQNKLAQNAAFLRLCTRRTVHTTCDITPMESAGKFECWLGHRLHLPLSRQLIWNERWFEFRAWRKSKFPELA